MTEPQKPNAQAGMINTETAAMLLMVTGEWIRRLVNGGWIKKQGKDQYRLVDVVQGYVKYLKDEKRQSSKSASASRAQDMRSEEIQIRIDERKQRVLREAQTDAIDIVAEYGGGLRADLLSLPPKLCADLKQRAKFAEAIDTAFGAASRRAAAAAHLIAGVGERMVAAGADKPRGVGRKKPNVPAKQRRSRAKKS